MRAALHAGLALTMICGTAGATTIPGATAQVLTGVVDASGVQTEQFTVTPGATGTSSLNSVAASAFSTADLTTGAAKVSTSGTTSPGATADPFDFLTFSGSGSVSYKMALSGSLSNLAPNGDVLISGAVYWYDVTGATSNVFTQQAGGYEYVNTGYMSSASSGQTVDVYGPSFSSSNLPISFGNFIVTTQQDDSGANIPVQVNATGSISVLAGHTYGIQLLLTAGADQLGGTHDQQAVNFADTALFSFTNLNGLTFTSASGQFLSNVAAVPEPGTVMLLGLGLLGLLARKVGRA